MSSEVYCWIEEFKKFIQTKGEDLPLKPSRFEYYLKRWPLETDKGAIETANHNFIIVNDKPLVSKFWALNVGSTYMGMKERKDLK